MYSELVSTGGVEKVTDPIVRARLAALQNQLDLNSRIEAWSVESRMRLGPAIAAVAGEPSSVEVQELAALTEMHLYWRWRLPVIKSDVLDAAVAAEAALEEALVER